jgi:hypothetical protein
VSFQFIIVSKSFVADLAKEILFLILLFLKNFIGPAMFSFSLGALSSVSKFIERSYQLRSRAEFLASCR